MYVIDTGTLPYEIKRNYILANPTLSISFLPLFLGLTPMEPLRSVLAKIIEEVLVGFGLLQSLNHLGRSLGALD